MAFYTNVWFWVFIIGLIILIIGIIAYFVQRNNGSAISTWVYVLLILGVGLAILGLIFWLVTDTTEVAVAAPVAVTPAVTVPVTMPAPVTERFPAPGGGYYQCTTITKNNPITEKQCIYQAPCPGAVPVVVAPSAVPQVPAVPVLSQPVVAAPVVQECPGGVCPRPVITTSTVSPVIAQSTISPIAGV